MTNLIFELNRESKIALGRQLINHLKRQISENILKKNDKLPSSRSLAKNLNVSRIITLSAYEQLIAEGYLIAKTGSGTFVSVNIPETPSHKSHNYTGPKWFKPQARKTNDIDDQDNHALYDFSIGPPAVNLLPKNSWKRAWRKALDQSLIGTRTERGGVLSLRQEIAYHLNRSRNIDCHPDNIIITSGTAETLRLISKAMAEFSPITYCEYPCFEIAEQWLSDNIRPINIDENGLIASELPQKTDQPTMLFCTPSHQFPLGFRLSLKRRNEILQWAQNNDALILEDDYDSEFHYDTMPLPTLKSQDETGQVVYFSSFSKSISPNIKIGYLIAPDNLCEVLKNIIFQEHADPPYLMQNAMAYFIKDGALDKHIAKSRRHYGKLNKIIREKLRNLPNSIKLFGLDSGIHCFLSFEKFPDQLMKNLAKKSFHLPLSIDKGKWHGFALGYGHFEEEDLKQALVILRSEIEKLYPEL